MNITDIEVIRALLEDPKVAWVDIRVVHTKTDGDSNDLEKSFETSSSFEQCAEIYANNDYEIVSSSITPIYHPVKEIGVGDLAWAQGLGKCVVLKVFNGKCEIDIPENKVAPVWVSTSKLTLLKEAKNV